MKSNLKRICLILAFSTIALVVMAHGLKLVRAQSDCGDEHCIYLPLIIKPPPPVRIASSWLTSGRAGDVYVWGQIENVTSVTVYSVTLGANLYDNADNLLGTYTGTTVLVATFPGELNPYLIGTDLWEWESDADHYDLSITSWSTSSPFEYKPVTVVSQEVTGSWPAIEVSGEIRNDYSQTLHSIRVLVEYTDVYGFYDFQRAYVSEVNLAPGETAGYSILIFYSPPLDVVSVRGQGYLNP